MGTPRVVVLDREPVCREVARQVFAALGASVDSTEVSSADLVVVDAPGRSAHAQTYVLGPVVNQLTPHLQLPLDRETAGHLIGRTPPPFDRAQFSALAGGVADAELEMVRDYFDYCSPQMEVLAEAVRAQDVEAVYTAAHRLTSSVGLMGARRASSLLRAIAERTHAGQLDGVAALLQDVVAEIARLERSLRRFLEVRQRPWRLALVGCSQMVAKVLGRRLSGLGLELVRHDGPTSITAGDNAAILIGARSDALQTVLDLREIDRDAPLLMVSGLGANADFRDALCAGADSTLDASASARQLCTAVDRWCAPGFDTRRLQLLYGSDSAERIFEVWQETAPGYAQALRSAHDATALAAAARDVWRATLAIGAGRAAALAQHLFEHRDAPDADLGASRLAARVETLFRRAARAESRPVEGRAASSGQG